MRIIDGRSELVTEKTSADTVLVAVAEKDIHAVRSSGFQALPLPREGRIPPEVLEAHADVGRIVMLLRQEDMYLFRRHLWHLDPPRVHVALMPEVITPDSLHTAVGLARPAILEGVLTLPEAAAGLREYLNSPAWQGLGSGWSALDRILTLRPGGSYNLLAYPKTGKSTFVTLLCLNLARYGRVAWHCSWEESAGEMTVRIAAAALGKPIDEVQVSDCDLLERMPLPLLISGSQQVPQTIEEFEGLVRRVHRRFGLDLVAVDNLHYIVRRHDRSVEALGVASKALRALAAELNLVMLIVLQPTKPERGADVPPNPFDARFSSDVVADAHATIVLHRYTRQDALREDGALEPEMLVRVERPRAMLGGDVLFMIDREHTNLREVTRQEVDAFLRRRKQVPHT